MDREEALALANRIQRDMGRVGTLQVTLYGGPGSGKSTARALLFAELKIRGRNVEEASEYAKDLVWEKAAGKLAFQPLIIAKQMWRMRRLEGQVEAVVTDTSTLLSLIYGGAENGVTDAFREWVIQEYRSNNTLDFFLERSPNMEYNPIGRTQRTLAEAQQADQAIMSMLDGIGCDYTKVMPDDYNEYISEMADKIERVLDLSTHSGLMPADRPTADLRAVERIITERRGDMELWEGGPPSTEEFYAALEEAMAKFQ